MKIIKKILIFFLVVFTVTSCELPFEINTPSYESSIIINQEIKENYVIIHEKIEYKFNNNEFSVVGYESGIVDAFIFSKINGYNVTSIGSYAFYECSSLTSIVIPESVTSIGDDAFAYCSSLTSITLSNSLTNIGAYAFSDCSSLTSIVIPESVTSIEEEAFRGCSSLTSITLPNSLTSIGSGAFSGCSSLTSITLPFIGQSADGSGNTHFGYIFGASSYSYNDDYVPSSLKEVIITNCTSIGERAFYWCSSLTSIVILEGVTSIGEDAFSGCSNLTSIVIPESVTSIGEDAFSWCSSLTIYCEASSQPGGWNLNWNDDNRPVYWGINESTYIEIEGIEYVIIYGEAVVSRYVGNNTEVIIPSTIEVKGISYNVTSIGSYAFSWCSSLTSIVIPKGVTSIEDGAFYYCSSLTSIVIPKGVTSIGEDAFSWCSSLTSITLPESVTSIGYRAFYYCSSLTSITLPNSLTSIGSYAFYDCRSLTNIVIPKGVTSIGYEAFYGCNSLTIYCEASSKPSGWNYTWNCSNRPVYYAGEWEYINGVPTPKK